MKPTSSAADAPARDERDARDVPPGRRVVVRLVLASVAAGFVAATVGAALLQWQARRALVAEILRRNELAAVRVASLFDDRIETAAGKLDLVATRREVIALAPTSAGELRVTLRTAGEFERLVLYDGQGRAVAAASGTGVLRSTEMLARPDLVDALATKRLVTRLITTEEPGVEVAVPVDNPPGTRIGVLAGVSALLELAETGQPSVLDAHATQLVVDRRGFVLFEPYRGTPPRSERVAILPREDQTFSRVVATEAGDMIISSAPSRLAPVAIVIREPERDAVAPAGRSLAQLIAILLLVVFASVLATSAVGGYLLRPLRAVADAAKRLGLGDQKVRVPVRGNDDVAMLAHEFNRMAASLEERIAELRERREREERLRQETRIAETLQEVGNALTARLEAGAVVQAVTDAATGLIGAEFGAFFYNIVDASGESYTLYTVSGAPRSAFEQFPMPRNTALFGTTFRGEGIVRIDDVHQDPRYGRSPPYHGMPKGHLPVRSYLACPVKSRSGDVIGGLFFGHALPGMFTEAHEHIVGGIAAQAAIAIDNARLYDLERQARQAAEDASRRLSLLADASRVLGSSLELESVLHGLASLLVPAVADVCTIDVFGDDRRLRRLATVADRHAWPVADAANAGAPDPADTRHPVARAIATGSTQYLGEVSVEEVERSMDEPPHELVRTSMVVAPLKGRTEVFGAMSLATAPSRHGILADADIRLVEELARRAAFAVENVRLFATQRGVAETLQRSLLPERLPPTPGLEAAARYLPGGPDVEVGGDWYDVLELPGGVLGVVLGDVVGRGIRAAAVMGQIRNAVRAYALDGRRPGDLLRRLNALQQDHGPEHLATMLYAELNLETGRFRYANAGHPPPLAVLPDGSTGYLETARGVPLGAVTETRFEEDEIDVPPGTTLVLYTDGLIERRDVSLDEGLERLRVATVEGPRDLEALADHILERMLDTGVAQDDVALLVLRPVTLSSPLRLRLPARPTVLGMLRATMRRWLTEVGASPDESYEILVATGEACANAIIHGSTSADDEFDVEIVLDGEVRVVVRDDGSWRETRAAGGGRGIGIMQAFMDEVQVVRGGNGTEVRLRRKLRSPARAST